MEVIENTEHIYNEGAMITAPVYNGEIWKKIDLITYIREAILLKANIEGYLQAIAQRLERQKFLAKQTAKKTLTYPEVEKPTGLAVLIPGKAKKYKEWLANEPQRTREIQKFEEKEEKRLKKINTEITALEALNKYDSAQAQKEYDAYNELMNRNIIPPDYREDAVLRRMYFYLMNSRANNLTEAINLYHQEKHWETVEATAEKQRQDIKEAQIQQEYMLKAQFRAQQEQMKLQSEQLNEIQRTATAAKQAAEWSEWWSMSEYFAVREFLNS